MWGYLVVALSGVALGYALKSRPRSWICLRCYMDKDASFGPSLIPPPPRPRVIPAPPP